MKMKSIVPMLLMVGMIFSLPLCAQTVTWTGRADITNWLSKENWSEEKLPDKQSRVVIPALSSKKYPVIPPAATVNVKVLEIDPRAELTVEGRLNITRDLFLKGSDSAGCLLHCSGSINFKNSAGAIKAHDQATFKDHCGNTYQGKSIAEHAENLFYYDDVNLDEVTFAYNKDRRTTTVHWGEPEPLLKSRFLTGLEMSLASGTNTVVEEFPFISAYFESFILGHPRSGMGGSLSLFGDIRLSSIAQSVAVAKPGGEDSTVLAEKRFQQAPTSAFELRTDNSLELIVGGLFPFHQTQFAGNKVTAYLIGVFGFNTLAQNTEISETFRRFDRQWLAGLRFKHTPKNHGTAEAFFDVLYGRIESARSKMGRGQIKLEGFFPFPVRAADFVYFSGTAILNLDTELDTESDSFAIDSYRFAITIRADEFIRDLSRGLAKK